MTWTLIPSLTIAALLLGGAASIAIEVQAAREHAARTRFERAIERLDHALGARGVFVTHVLSLWPSLSPAGQIQALRSLGEGPLSFSSVVALEGSSRVVASWPPQAAAVGDDWSTRPIVREATATGEPAWRSVDTAGTPQRSLAVAAVGGGAALVGILDAGRRSRLVQAAVGPQGKAALLDADDRRLAAQDHSARTELEGRVLSNLTLVVAYPDSEAAPTWWTLVVLGLVAALAVVVSHRVLRTFDQSLLAALSTVQSQAEDLVLASLDQELRLTHFHELNDILLSLDRLRLRLRTREQDLRLTEYRFRRLYENSALGILHSTVEGRILDANQALAELLGYDGPDDLRTKTGDQAEALYVRPEERRALLQMIASSPEAKVTLTTQWWSAGRRPVSVKLNLARVYDVVERQSILEAYVEDIAVWLSTDTLVDGQSRVLEDRVAERTKHLQRALEQLTQSQSHRVQSEKSAALAQLVASIAHELNTPLGAIRAANDSIGSLVRHRLVDWPTELVTLPAGILTAATALFRESTHELTVPSSAEVRSRRKRLEAKLVGLSIKLSHEAKEELVEMNWSGEPEPWLANPEGARAVHFAYELICLERSCAVISQAVDRSTHVVAALRGATIDHADEPFQRVVVRESVMEALALFQDRLAEGVKLETRWVWDPWVWALPDRLAQVWTNLISNALDSMSGKGRLNILLSHDPGGVKVSIVDSGPGIAPEHQEKIFTPYFTSKSAEHGTGLGLDICSRIVQEHDGTIGFASRPGRTEFYVVLPEGR